MNKLPIAAVLLLFSATLASAATPSDVSDLVGARGAGGEQALGSRGYDYVTMTKGTQYWWNAERSACIGIKVAEGRYQSVSSAPASKCNQSANAASSGSDVSDDAKTACMAAINDNYGGKVDDLNIVRSQFSQANSEVIVEAIGVRGTSDRERWKCLVSNNGKVADLSVLGN